MLNLIGWDEISEILGLDDEACDENYIEGVVKRTIGTYKERPGFFTPYDNGYEVVGGLLSPIWYPIALTVGTAFLAFTTLIAACYFVGFLLYGLGSIIAMSTEHRNTALEGITNSLALTGLSLLGTATAALLTVLSIPHSIVSFVTRSAATLVTKAIESCKENASLTL